jgi:hypothetical protein
VVAQISGHHRDLFVKGQGTKVANGLTSRYIKAALEKCCT